MAKKKRVKNGGIKQDDSLGASNRSVTKSSMLPPEADKVAMSETDSAKLQQGNKSKSEKLNVLGEKNQESKTVDLKNNSELIPSTSNDTSSPVDTGSSAKHSKRKKDILSKIEGRINMKRRKIKDPRLIPRMQEYLDGRANKNFVSIPLMAEHLQAKYPEYARKKRSMFVQYVDKAYSYMEKPSFSDPPPPLSDTDESSDKELVAENGHYVWKKVSEHSRDISDVENETEDGVDEVTIDNSESSECDNENLVEYKDTNALNNSLKNLYKYNGPHYASKLPPPLSDNSKRKTSDTTGPMLKKPCHDQNKVVYPSPNVLERNLTSTGLVGPRRTASDKYFIDRKGDNSKLVKEKSSTGVKETREVTIQRFLGNLPSRTSYSAYVTGKTDMHAAGSSLYRVYTGRSEDKEMANLAHPGITQDNVGISCDPPKSPSQEGDVTVVGNDPRRKGGRQEMAQTIQGTQYNADLFADKTASKTPKKKKGSTRSRKQDDSETEESKKIKGPVAQKSSVKFEDVGGNEATLTEICKLLVHMRHPEVYQQLGVTPPRGFLLHGPPGCGKTLLANAIAGELDLPMIKIAATEIVSGVSGDSEEKIRDLFDKATQSAPCVVFIDEIDSITPKRETASKDMERRIVAQLLACMDDLNANPSCHVLVIGATNRPDSLDPALRRAGRFDREISLGIPDEKSRLRILQVLCRTLRLSPDFEFAYLARNTPGYVGADLMALAREAAMTAVNRVFQDLQSSLNKTSVSKPARKTSVDCNQRVVDTSHITSLQLVPSSGSAESTCQSGPGTSASSLNSYTLLSTGSPVSQEQGAKTDSVCSTTNQNSSNFSIPITASTEMTSVDTTEFMETTENNVINNVQENVLTCSDDVSETKKASADTTVTSVLSLDSDGMDSFMSKPQDLTQTAVDVDCEQTSNLFAVSDSKGNSEKVQDFNSESSPYLSVLPWLKDLPPLTEAQLADLYITLDDFKEALKYVQPSAKREGFATIPDVTWEDIGALHEVREELELAILAPVRHPEQFKRLGLTTAQGVLLAGPPGCGKTLLAKAIANETGINFISVKGPELLNMYVGESERAVRTVFQRARNSAPCVIFFDELDALCPKRSGSSEGNSSARVVNQLLTEMDGLEERKQVFIMAATNRPDIIDPAVLRPGRLDKMLYVGLPSESDRLDILTCITKNGTKPQLAEDVSLATIAADSRCNCFTGADLSALVREASVAALKQAITKGQQPSGTIVVKGEHFETAFKKTKPSVTLKDQEKYSSMKAKLAIDQGIDNDSR